MIAILTLEERREKMKTLEQVIKDVCARHLAAYKVNRYDAEAIANDVREWLREQNKRLKVVIEEALIDVDPGFNDLELDEMSNAVLSVLPFYETKSETEHFKGNHEVVATKLVEFFSMHGEKLQSTTFEQLASYITLPPLDPKTLQTEMEKWQAGEMDRLRLELEKVTSWSPSQAEEIIQLRKELQRSGQIIDDLKIKLEDIKSRAKFLPGDSVWVLYGAKISRGIVWAVREGILRVTVTEQEITKDFLFRDVYATAEECRANIPVEE